MELKKHKLATNTDFIISKKHELAEEISEHLGEKYRFWRKQIIDSNKSYSYLKREFEVIKEKDYNTKYKAKILMSLL